MGREQKEQGRGEGGGGGEEENSSPSLVFFALAPFSPRPFRRKLLLAVLYFVRERLLRRQAPPRLALLYAGCINLRNLLIKNLIK